jgi:hypothetical protein
MLGHVRHRHGHVTARHVRAVTFFNSDTKFALTVEKRSAAILRSQLCAFATGKLYPWAVKGQCRTTALSSEVTKVCFLLKCRVFMCLILIYKLKIHFIYVVYTFSVYFSFQCQYLYILYKCKQNLFELVYRKIWQMLPLQYHAQ